MIADRHSFTSNGNYCNPENVIGRNWAQPDIGDTVGEVAYAFQNSDVALLDTSLSSRSISNEIIFESGKVVGRVTKEGMAYLQSTPSTVQKRGINTCSKSGQVVETGIFLPCTNLNYVDDFVRSTPTQDFGDSGAPVYYEEYDSDFDKLYLAHIATQKDANDNALGASADAINKDHGIWYGGHPFSGP